MQPILARKIKVTTNLRCDFDHGIIPKGKHATQVIGDPETVKAQGMYHGRQCYEAALADYTKKKEDFDMQKEVDNV